MSSMAEVIWEHWTDAPFYCRCGHEYPRQGVYVSDRAEHVAAELAAAGYGNKADAWDEGHHAPTPSGYLQDTPNPYRGAGHE
jgi:hypothetical protein